MKLIAVSTRDSEGSNILSLFKTVSPLGIIGYIIGILFIRWVLRGLHRIYFHPLRKFPGPKLSAFTRIPHIRAVCKGELHKYVARLHETYGEVVRISPDELSFVHPQVWQDIYGRGPKEGKGSAPPKDWSRQAKPVNGVPPIISIPDNARHARTRKIFSPAFSDRALAQQAPLFNKYADKLVDCLRAGGSEGRKFDMVRMWNFVSFDIMGDLTFGESLHMLDSAQYDPWVQGIFRSVKVSVRLGILYFYYPLAGSIIRKFLHRLMAKKAYEHHNHSAMRVTKRLEKGRASEGIDLWDLVLQHQEKDKTVLSRPEMDSNANLFMLAGTETTATAMSALTYLLLTNPRTMETLVNEIRDTFENPSQVTMDKVQALPYLNACIKEALRVHAAVPAGQPHRTPKEGSTVCGRYVPPDVVVAGHHWVVYRSPSLWTDPTKFAPERWMGDVRYTNDQLSSVQAFSTGPRDCLGKNMAMHEMRLLVTKVLYNFDLSLCPESEGWSERQKLWVLWEKIPLMVEVKDARRE